MKIVDVKFNDVTWKFRDADFDSKANNAAAEKTKDRILGRLAQATHLEPLVINHRNTTVPPAGTGIRFSVTTSFTLPFPCPAESPLVPLYRAIRVEIGEPLLDFVGTVTVEFELVGALAKKKKP